MQNFTDLLQGKHFQIFKIKSKGGKKMCIFNGKLIISYLGNGERYGQGYY